MPTPQQKRIIGTIRRLYRRGDPLNIAAVKRSHPELMRAVYAVKPFWGWKRALEDAGIDYRKIKIALQDTIKCALCGKSFRNLGNHLILKHKVRPDEYLMDYPDTELQSETLRAEKTARETLLLRHWEPVWTREYALDRLAEYRRRGFPIHQSKLDKSDPGLYMAVSRYCNGWKAAMMAMGLDPLAITKEAYCRLRRYQDKESVIAGIKARQRRGLALSHRALKGSSTEKKIDCALFISGADLFGSWDTALRAAGVDPKVVRMSGSKKQIYPSPESVIKELRERTKRKWPVNHAALYRGIHIDVPLVRSGNDYFGSWNKTLQTVGIDAKALTDELRRRTRRYPDQQSILKAIRQRIGRGILVNFSSLTRGKHRDHALIAWGIDYFGSWDRALEAAGIDPLAVRILQVNRYPDKPSVVTAIRRRRAAGLPLNHGAVQKGQHRDRSLVEMAKRYFGSWDKALMAAGINPDKIRKRSCRKKKCS